MPEPDFASEIAALRSRIGAVAMAAGVQSGTGAQRIAIAGEARRGGGQQPGPDSPWHIGSITKGMTAALLMRLAERGAFAFDAPLGQLLPNYADEMHPGWAALRLPRILSHSAGLPANFSIREMWADHGPDPAAARLGLLRRYWSRPPARRPGRIRYSNLGYTLAGVVAEETCGAPWDTLLRQEIATPLGLTSLGFGPPSGEGAPWGHRGPWFRKRPVDPMGPRADNPDLIAPAGKVHLSMADLLRWGRAMLEARAGRMPQFLSQAGARRLVTPVAGEYALGWIVTHQKRLGVDVITHDGSNTMWFAVLALVPERDLVAAVALNEGSARKAYRAIMALARAQAPTARRQPSTMPR